MLSTSTAPLSASFFESLSSKNRPMHYFIRKTHPQKLIYSKDVGDISSNRDQKRISDFRLAHVDVSGRNQLFKVRNNSRSIEIVAQSDVNSFLLFSKDLVKFLLKKIKNSPTHPNYEFFVKPDLSLGDGISSQLSSNVKEELVVFLVQIKDLSH